jgi:hypothetical protein
MKPRFHRPQGDLPFRGDFALTHPFEKCEINHLFLCFGQFLHHAIKKFCQVVDLNLVRRGDCLIRQWIVRVRFQAFGRAAYKRLFAVIDPRSVCVLR